MSEDHRDDLSLDPEAPTSASGSQAYSSAQTESLGSATYEIIRQRLESKAAVLTERMSRLDASRKEVFGTIEFKLLQADRIVTSHNCIPRDMVQLGDGRFLCGFNVQFGLKKDIQIEDVFAVYVRDEASGGFKESNLSPIQDHDFITDFQRLYNIYEKACFRKFSVIEGQLYMVFAVGEGANDIAVFKWAYNDGNPRFIDGRAEAEYRRVGFPAAHEFRWITPDRDAFRYGDHPHISILDQVFVDCIGGTLTIKIEDNTDSGEGIYEEPVDDKHQKVDDADVSFAEIDHLILLKIRPYKETQTRYFIFNLKQQQAVRVDSIGQSCVRLPEDHGLIFPDGYYLASGELKRFECREKDMLVERVVHAPNGEDSLFVFYNRLTGDYVLMPYKLITQKVEERISCHGFSLFPTGHLLLFRADPAPQKHHMIQLRQTPFHLPGHEPAGNRDAFLFQVGNKEVVRCLAECNEILTLVRKESPYAELYTDLVRQCGSVIDSYPWLSHSEAYGLDDGLKQVREAADKAVDEFDKVRRLRHEAVQKVKELKSKADLLFNQLRRAGFDSLNDYVSNLSNLRKLRGECITLKEVRYVDLESIGLIEEKVVEETQTLSRGCVDFLLKPEALAPYQTQAAEFLKSVEKTSTVSDCRKIENQTAKAGGELEMLIDIVNTLKIEDATETTRIIDAITLVYSTLNQVKAALKQRLKKLAASEGAAQFGAQMKLIGQSASSYLDLCDTPAKCDDYLNRISVQLEELEGIFADFEEYTLKLAERRTELYEAFEQRKISLIEQRHRRANALMTAAGRILKVIQNRLAGFKTIAEIQTYMASDLMIGKIRDTINQLTALEDTVKADDLMGRLKGAQQEAVRQLRDRQDLFSGGEGTIQFGKHRFNTNTQPLDLTLVNRDGDQYLHLTSTQYFEKITHPAFLETRDVWDQQWVSENQNVYRSEYLAFQFLNSLLQDPSNNGSEKPGNLKEIQALSFDKKLNLIQEFMATLYQEGYTKGVHDHDAVLILDALITAHIGLDLTRTPPTARACARIYWTRFIPSDTRELWTAKLKGFSARNQVFPGHPTQQLYIDDLRQLISGFIEKTNLYPPTTSRQAGEYLFAELTGDDRFVVSREAHQGVVDFNQHLVIKGREKLFEQGRLALHEHPESDLELVRDWVRGFLIERPVLSPFLEEMAALLFCGESENLRVIETASRTVIHDMKGSHSLIQERSYSFDYLDFQERLHTFANESVPKYQGFQRLKQSLLDEEREKLRLDEFKPKVLSSFVRNELIDKLFLPMIGDNLAKQIGAAGDKKRTDLMGLLLLVSPPGYGKTTLMEYIASRLGIVFVKINGPALGHHVTSLDPEEAPNAAAREEIVKLNLALEMGDNAMIYLDDIQHCHSELLQKFISLCDAQRKIEGVWKGRSKTYDLRGRKVVVVMAGNPYTESGEKFRIPDMLANRADTYNLGDIIGGSEAWFKASYLENAVTSNAVLAPLANKSQKDVRHFIQMAGSNERDTEGFEGSYSSHEIEEILSVMKKLILIREVVLKVNLEYIRSAAQSDDYRTEPPFRLQGSYRNMNRLAEKVVSIMNDEEIHELIMDHYKSESQTLTTGAEANFLKFKELTDTQTESEKARWEDIKKTFKRNQMVRGGDENDPVSRVVAQLSVFQSGLEGIQGVLEKQWSQPQKTAPITLDVSTLTQCIENLRSSLEQGLAHSHSKHGQSADFTVISAQLGESLREFREDLNRTISEVHSGSMADKVNSLSHEMEMIHSTLATLKDMAARQRDHLRNSQELLAERARQGSVEIELTQEMLGNEKAFLEHFHRVMEEARKSRNPDPESENNA